MSPESFCFWLQGYFKISGRKELTSEQVAVVQEHLNLVFKKITTKKVESFMTTNAPHGKTAVVICPEEDSDAPIFI